MGSRGGVVQDRTVGVGTVPLRIVRDSTVPAPVDRTDPRDSFRAAVVALDAGPLQEVLTAVAYARDEAARTRSSTVPADRWSAVVKAAERAVAAVDAGLPERRVAGPVAPRVIVAQVSRELRRSARGGDEGSPGAGSAGSRALARIATSARAASDDVQSVGPELLFDALEQGGRRWSHA